MMNERDGLAMYRRLEFPNETRRSWPIAQSDRHELAISYVRVAHEPKADAEKKIAA